MRKTDDAVGMEKIRRIGFFIAHGLTEEQACRACRVPFQAFRYAKTKEPYSEAIKEAHADFLAEAVIAIRMGVKSWQSIAWLLERRHKPQFDQSSRPPAQAPVPDVSVTLNNSITPEVMALARQYAAEASMGGSNANNRTEHDKQTHAVDAAATQRRSDRAPRA